jgi:hypothetical protein
MGNPVVEQKIRDVAKKQGVIPGALDELLARADEFGVNSIGKIRKLTDPTITIKDFIKAKCRERPEITSGTKFEKIKKTNNPFHKYAWNVTEQARLVKAIGLEKAEAIAKAAGVKIGATKPNADF